ncbi:electron transfer flavoprotein subunit alpha/FixB family protein [Mangrovibacter plantisponsor]|uniref:Electron transfer flavoprotein alpha subunit apoprotein n=1 Tax=Mangrovibacter plantisponsor TaxID=451513 RepID=A0A317QCC9_9ENTR|nr:electron transfer flavoprotein subunit alpha/FixB family protein [Mangrovibacter plantisponsor]PWW12640.1 electron transfer flavoprotein alpha subunit apoprotein [Mangrovibacter plantisponsor]
MDSIIRRDPRAEWIQRNRLHPQHTELALFGQETRGPTGLLRKNPHAQGFIGPAGIKRIDRMNISAFVNPAGRRSATVSKVVELPLHRVENPEYYIAVVPDMVGGRLTSHDKDIIGLAHERIRHMGGAGAVLAIVFGEHREEAFDTAGVDRLIHLTGEQYQGYSPEYCTNALAAVEKELAPLLWLFPDSVTAGFELGCRFAARVGERPATQVWRVDEKTCTGRAAGGTLDITRQIPRVLLLAPECANPIDETRHEALPVVPGPWSVKPVHIKDCGQVPVDPAAVPLAEAEFILSAGNGVNDWSQFHKTAEILGATEGASRVAVDNGHMPRLRQVGATGTWVTARVYLAVGISGAIQHLQGIGQCDKVIAINTDPGCDMVKRASLSVIADSDEIMAELARLAQAWRKEELNDAA